MNRAGILPYLSRARDCWQSAADGRRAAAVVVFCATLFILVNWRDFVADDIPQSLVPVTLWREGTIRLDSFQPDYDKLKETRQHYAFTESGGHLYPRNSVYVSLLIAPLYLPPVLSGRDLHDLRFWVAWGTVCAAFFTAISVAFTYLTLRRWVDDAAALVLSLLCAFGTCLWTVIGHQQIGLAVVIEIKKTRPRAELCCVFFLLCGRRTELQRPGEG